MLSENVGKVNSQSSALFACNSDVAFTFPWLHELIGWLITLITSLDTDVLHPFTPCMLESALLDPAVFVIPSTCCTTSNLTSTLFGMAGDVLSDVPVISLACKSANVAPNLDISAELCCLMSQISPEIVLNLLSTYSLDLLISLFKFSTVTPICSLCSLILASN